MDIETQQRACHMAAILSKNDAGRVTFVRILSALAYVGPLVYLAKQVENVGRIDTEDGVEFNQVKRAYAHPVAATDANRQRPSPPRRCRHQIHVNNRNARGHTAFGRIEQRQNQCLSLPPSSMPLA